MTDCNVYYVDYDSDNMISVIFRTRKLRYVTQITKFNACASRFQGSSFIEVFCFVYTYIYEFYGYH